MNNLNTQQKVLYLLDLSHKEYKKYIYENYLNIEKIPLFMREFYSESSSWFTNQDIDSMKNTIHWSTMKDSQKLNLLDQDLEGYFESDNDETLSQYSYQSSRTSYSDNSSDTSDSSQFSIMSKLSNLSNMSSNSNHSNHSNMSSNSNHSK